MNNPPAVLTIAGLRECYRSGALDPRELVDEILRRIHRAGSPEVWIGRVDEAEVRKRAAELAGILEQQGETAFEAFPLLGIPYAVKDNIDAGGLPTTAACPEFAYVPPESAPAVKCLEAAGAILIGKTNLDQFATGLTGTRSPYGVVANPFDRRYISGGSSSGSAVAVASGCVAFALGTDTAGSGRVPAGFCNLVGIKPTPGLVSTRGVVPACRSLDCVSIFSHTVADGWDVLRQLAGPDPEDPYSRAIESLPLCLGGVRTGVPRPLDFLGDGMAEAAFGATLEQIAGVPGVSLVEVDFSVFADTAALLYEGPWVAERRAALGDFFPNHGRAIEPSVHRVLARAERWSAVDAFRGLHRLQEYRRQAAKLFGSIDLLLVPTAPTHYTLEAVAEAPIERNGNLGRYTNFVNLLGLSALALPGLFRSDGLPAGITLIAPGGGDHRLAEFARRLEPLIHQRLGLGVEEPPRSAARLAPLPGVEPKARVAVVGAHLSGQALNWQLTERGGRRVRATRTAPCYRLFALPDTAPPKPGLVRAESGGDAIEIEVWELPLRNYGSFVAEIPAPLAIGTLELADGERVQGFLCEPWALAGARDITAFGGWRHFLAATAGASGY